MKKRSRKVSKGPAGRDRAAGGAPAPKPPPGANVTGRGRIRNLGRERVAERAGRDSEVPPERT
jgi:hypothetical protein